MPEGLLPFQTQPFTRVCWPYEVYIAWSASMLRGGPHASTNHPVSRDAAHCNPGALICHDMGSANHRPRGKAERGLFLVA